MRSRHVTAIALLAAALVPRGAHGQQTPRDMAGSADAPVTPRSFRWMRVLSPPRRAPLAEACVVLDADVFAHAAPALRDLRLYQDGAELPFVIEQSFDEDALNSGETAADDRSLYETAAVGLLQPSASSGADAQGFHASIELPARVPVERIRLQTPPTLPTLMGVRAEMTVPTLLGAGAENTKGTVDEVHPALPFTIGANLQSPAAVTVLLAGRGARAGRVLLEMRRRSLCYHPASASPLTLYLGGGDIAAESYPFARTFQSEAERPYASMGPLLPNPEFHPGAATRWHADRRVKLLVAAFAFALLFLLNSRRLLRKQKRVAR